MKPRIRHGQIGNPTPNKIEKDGTDLLIGGKKLANLYNKAHIIPSDKYREGYDRIRWEREGEDDRYNRSKI